MFISPEADILVYAIVINLFISGVSLFFRKKYLGKDHEKKLKEKQEKLKRMLKENSYNIEEVKKVEQEIVKLSVKSFQASMPVMLLSLLTFIVFIKLVGPEYEKYSYPLVGNWLLFYFIVSLVVSLFISVGTKLIGRFKDARV